MKTKTSPVHSTTETAATPASRASWTGRLQVSRLSVPVKAYAAVATTTGTQLHQLHAGCGERIEHRKWCPIHGAVESAHIVKGFPYEHDHCIELSDDELAEIKPADDKTLILDRFFDPQHLDLILLSGRSLHLVPAHSAASAPYALVFHAFQNTGKWALGRVVFSGRRQLVVVRPLPTGLVLHTLHDPIQRRAAMVTVNGTPKVKQSELKPLVKFFTTQNGPIRWEDFVDDTDAKLASLVADKVCPTKPQVIKLNGRRRQGTSPKARRTKTRVRSKAA